MYRSEQDYNAAIKAYKQALHWDPNNLQILRDLSMLQIQMRDWDGFVSTRNTLLTLKSNAKVNWLAFGVGRHLNGDLEGAVQVIDIYLGTLSEGSAELGRSFESSELALYKNQILAELDPQRALTHLDDCRGIVVDKGAWWMRRAECQIVLGDYASALASVTAMLDRGMTEDHRVHSLYMCAVLEVEGDVCRQVLQLKGTNTLATMIPLSNEQIAKLNETYAELVAKYPQSKAMQRIPTQWKEGQDLMEALAARCRMDLPRGVPSLCDELLSYVVSEKANGRLYRTKDPVELRAHPTYQAICQMADSFVAAEENDSDTRLWALFLRARLHEEATEYAPGLALAEKCLELSPELVDLYELKARLLQGAGDVKAAAACVDQGREKDLQDRYINNLTTKFFLQAGMEKEAVDRISLFTKHEGNARQNLFDMQCSWFELEYGACMARKKSWGPALKQYCT